MRKWIVTGACICAIGAAMLILSAFRTPKYLTRYNTMIACEYFLWNQTTPTMFLKKLFENRGQLGAKDILHRVMTNLPHLRGKMRDASIVYVSSNDFEEYCNELVLKGDKRVILVVKGDPTFPDEYSCCDRIEEILASKNLGHIFVQNNNYQGKTNKVSSLPVGINHPKEYKFPFSPRRFDRKIDCILANLKPTTERNTRPLCDFQFANSSAKRLNKMGEDRSDVARLLHEKGVCDFLEARVPQLELYRLKGERAFDISPIGNGFDCYRTWESLMLGCIVIVKSSFLDPMFEGLPVVIINDWSEITEDNLQKWLEQYGDVFHEKNVREKITHKYWMGEIRKVQQQLRIASNS